MMIPVHVSESVTVAALPKFEERHEGCYVDFSLKKRFNQRVNLESRLTPVKFSSTIVCFKNCTRKRFVTNDFYEPRVKPKTFRESVMIFPKYADKTYSSSLVYHMDESRNWYRTTVKFEAKDRGSSEMEVPKENGIDNNFGPGVSHILLPQFEKYRNSDNYNINNVYIETLMNGDINSNDLNGCHVDAYFEL